MTTDQSRLTMIAQATHATVVVDTWPARDIMTRNDYQEAFRTEAMRRGVENKTPAMGFVVSRCLSMSGFGG